EILSVALNSEFRDPTLAAVERISSRDELDDIAARAKNKSASKRARALVREIDDRLAAEAAALQAAASEEREAREAADAARRAAEAAKIVAIDDLAAARRQFALVRKEWNRVAAAGPADPAIALRYADVDAAFAARDAAAREADERSRREALTRLQQVTSRIEA